MVFIKKIFFLAVASLLAACASPAPGAGLPAQTPTPLPTATATPAAQTCTVLHLPATPPALGLQFGDRGHASGPVNAPVTIVIFSDYECPACAYVAATLKRIRLAHPNDVRIVSINTPLAGFDKDTLAIQAAEAADMQGKFWEMNDLLFAKLNEWAGLAPAAFTEWAAGQAAGLGLDKARFQADFQGQVVSARLQEIVQSTGSHPVTPPVLFVNDTTAYSGLVDFANLDTVVRMDALAARQFSACPPWSVDPLKQYIATLHTSRGDVAIQLYPDKTPQAVNNFIYLARQGWYDGVAFYKVMPNFLAMTGDPSDTGLGGPGYLFPTEMAAGLHFDRAGLVAMDNTGPDTNGSRFFITLDADQQLEGKYTIFGKVLSGMDVVAALAARNPQPGVSLPEGDTVLSVTVEER